MDAKQVNEVFHKITNKYRGEPCPACRSKATMPYLYGNVIVLSCEECGTGTRKGRIRIT